MKHFFYSFWRSQRDVKRQRISLPVSPINRLMFSQIGFNDEGAGWDNYVITEYLAESLNKRLW